MSPEHERVLLYTLIGGMIAFWIYLALNVLEW